jgi:hypothetical protein
MIHKIFSEYHPNKDPIPTECHPNSALIKNYLELSCLKVLRPKVPFGKCLAAVKGCPNIHLWEPKPHSAGKEQSLNTPAGSSAKRLVFSANTLLVFIENKILWEV